ncbi:unnamed protein product [Sphagnum jensenii]|uniref:Photosystem II subunit Q-2 n=1 Tax=Sphagnum jensenii TaxID=128206 RepID=A0ABP1BUX5_9BRYO
MANAVASMAGLRGASQAVLEGALSSTRVPSHKSSSSSSSSSRVFGASGAAGKSILVAVRAQQNEEPETVSQSSRRSVLGLLAVSVAASTLVKQEAAQAEVASIPIEGPPPLSGGLPGTENADEARDFDLPQKQRFFIQILPPDQAAKRAKDAAEAIVGVKTLIDNKAWPYVQNGLRDYAGSLRYDLNTVIGSKPKEEKRALKAITAELYESLDKLDYAARVKSPTDAEKYYSKAVGLLKTVITKI